MKKVATVAILGLVVALAGCKHRKCHKCDVHHHKVEAIKQERACK